MKMKLEMEIKSDYSLIGSLRFARHRQTNLSTIARLADTQIAKRKTNNTHTNRDTDRLIQLPSRSSSL